MSLAEHQLWRERLNTPAYAVSEAARYARTTVQTISNWQDRGHNKRGAISDRARGSGLSYLQLIELGVVAAMRKSGVRLDRIKDARSYLAEEIGSEFPFAEYRFKTDGRHLFVDYDRIAGSKNSQKLVVVSEGGQLAWNQILSELLREFEYDSELNKVSAWRVAGYDSPVLIDPRVCFGAPQVGGIATWTLRERWASGENLEDIADDYDLEPQFVRSALRFEGLEVDPDRPSQWVH